MFERVEQRINALTQLGAVSTLRTSLIGIEKESLRVSADGHISQYPHPPGLGSALTHPFITTDYSEALLECITPALHEKRDVLNFLRDIHVFVYRCLEDEIIWATSMPCIVAGEAGIPIAQYGSSNRGKMKTVYRNGLGYRYGRIMQVIAGVHFNYSFGDPFWLAYKMSENNGDDMIRFQSDRYFDLLRNLQRFGWMVSYLFGASPAVCKSFLAGKQTDMEDFSPHTYYEPYATSLRMGDIGYQNNKEMCAGVKANYDNLEKYVESLKTATETPCKDYEQLGVKVDGEYRQLNTNLLQIENEYYSSVRPKQITDAFEKPVLALRKRGVAYVELRSIDVNAFDPLGINEDQLHFIEAFILFCLLQDSPLIGEREKEEIDYNQSVVAHQGREPGLELTVLNKTQPLKTWALAILKAMEPVCGCLDQAHGTNDYTRVLQEQKRIAANPALTPSALIIDEMRQAGEEFFQFALRKSLAHRDYFKSLQLSPEVSANFQWHVSQSIDEQKAIEESDELSFDAYLERYFNQA